MGGCTSTPGVPGTYYVPGGNGAIGSNAMPMTSQYPYSGGNMQLGTNQTSFQGPSFQGGQSGIQVMQPQGGISAVTYGAPIVQPPQGNISTVTYGAQPMGYPISTLGGGMAINPGFRPGTPPPSGNISVVNYGQVGANTGINMRPPANYTTGNTSALLIGGSPGGYNGMPSTTVTTTTNTVTPVGMGGMGIQGMGIQGMGIQGMGMQGMGMQGMGMQGMGMQGMGGQIGGGLSNPYPPTYGPAVISSGTGVGVGMPPGPGVPYGLNQAGGMPYNTPGRVF